MPGIARNGQDVAGGVAIQGSSNVNVNSKGVVRLGDNVASHGLPPHSPTPPATSCPFLDIPGILSSLSCFSCSFCR